MQTRRQLPAAGRSAVREVFAYLRRPPMLVVLALELLMLLALCLRAATPPADIELTPSQLIDISSTTLLTDADGYIGMEATEDWTQDTVMLATDTMELPGGPYLVTVQYKAEDKRALGTRPYVSFRTEHPGTLLEYDGEVDMLATSRTFRVAVLHRCTDARIEFGTGACRFYVGSISIHYDVTLAWLQILLLALLFAALDAALLRLLPGSPLALCAADRVAMLGLIGIFVLASALVLQSGGNGGHDWVFHLSRIEYTADALRLGQFPVRVYPTAKDGFGYGAPLFYGQLFLYFPALLRLMGLPVGAAIHAYMHAVTAATVLLSYWCFKRIFGRRSLALLGSFLYTLASYRLICVYVRSAVGEYTAMIFLPLLAWGLWRLYGPDEEARPGAWVPLLLAFGGILQSHMLTFLMAVFTTLCLVLVFWRRTFRPRTLLVWAKAAGGCILVNLWFLLPFLAASAGRLPESGDWLAERAMTLPQLLFKDDTATLGLALLPGAALFAALCLWKKRADPLRALGLTSAGVAVGACWMASTLFPWAALQSSELLGDVVGTLQFPWRWLGTASLALVLVTLCAVEEVWRARDRIAAALAAALPVVLTLTMFITFCEENVDTDPPETLLDPSQTRAAMDSLYDPPGTMWNGLTYGIADPYNAAVYSMTRVDGKLIVDCAGDDPEGFIELPLLYYPGYRVLEGEGTLYQSDRGVVGLAVSGEWSGPVTIGYREPLRWLLADAVSLLSAAGLLGQGLVRRAKRRRGAAGENKA